MTRLADATRGRIGLVAGICVLVAVAAVYPLFADRTDHPLGVFVLPILVVAALATPAQALVVGALSVAVAATEGQAVSDLGGGSMAARMTFLVATAGAGWLLATIRHDRERTVTEADRTADLMETFQRVLVPKPSPPPGLHVRTRYVPGEERLLLGGDFLDALDLPDGSLGFIVGDVCGHGPDAAALGAALRAGWKTLATYAPTSPAAWVAAMDDAFFGHGRHDTFATVCTGRIDPDGRVRFVSCGHPWPIVIGDQPELCRPHVARPLGVRGAPLELTETTLELPVGAALLIHTDGLIENGAERGGPNERELLDHLRTNRGPDLDRLIEAFGPHGFADDVAVMSISLAPDDDGPTPRRHATVEMTSSNAGPSPSW